MDQDNNSLDQEKKLRDVQHEREVVLFKQVLNEYMQNYVVG